MREGLCVDGVHLCEVGHVGQEHVDLDDAGDVGAGGGEDGADVCDAGGGLGGDGARDEGARGVGGDAAGDEEVGACADGVGLCRRRGG